MTPNDTPKITTGSIKTIKLYSIILPLPFFKGWGRFAVKQYLTNVLANILKFESEIAFSGSNLKKNIDNGTTSPLPGIPAILVKQRRASIMKKPQNSKHFNGHKFLWTQIPPEVLLILVVWQYSQPSGRQSELVVHAF